MFIPALCAESMEKSRHVEEVVGEILPDMVDLDFAEPVPFSHHQIFLGCLCPSPTALLCSSALPQTYLGESSMILRLFSNLNNSTIPSSTHQSLSPPLEVSI